ncbi:hypothetical protein BLA39750_05857 [Burkholderia lata]|uniref:Uncharacterized protein n=1 Tax=Burkholderia lata (strain ATCC 17760 / DSM 23089 / LMG 22485 / NCIMB 9086 / R18194 / 383) TaxID=482957 RepID=A0A6P3AVJ7_BURL3|nr:hypothetical protein BLA39750_05857 [Burkholderia lata]
MASQRKRRAAHHVAQVALAFRPLALCVNLFHPHQCECVAILRFRIVTRPLVTFELIVRRVARQAVLRGQGRARFLEVEIVGGPHARLQALRGFEVVDVLPVDLLARRVVRECLIGNAFHTSMSTWAVDQHQSVHALRVFEEPRDAVLFHQPLGKCKIRLAILDLITQRLVCATNAHLERVQIWAEHLAQNVQHVLALEDAVIGPLPRQCKPWLQHDPITRLPIQLVHIACRRHDAADFSCASTQVGGPHLPGHSRDKAAHPVELDRDGQFLAEHRLEIKVGQQVDRQQRIGWRRQP